MKKSKGFTLIELLVVIAIIGLLAAIVLVSMTNSRRRAQDSKRVSDLRQIALALEMYNSNNGVYPGNPDTTGCDEGNGPGSALFNALQNSTYISAMPTDPLGPTIYYGYEGFNPSGSGLVNDYVLRATLVTCNPNSGNCKYDVDTSPTGCVCADASGGYCLMP